MYLVVTYDISNNKSRTQIVKILESYGFRVQESVFEIELNKNQFVIMKKSILYWLEYAKSKYGKNTENNDSIKFYILSKVGEGNLDGRIDGLGEGYNHIFFDDVLIL